MLRNIMTVTAEYEYLTPIFNNLVPEKGSQVDNMLIMGVIHSPF